MKLSVIILSFIVISMGIASIVSAEKMWGDEGYKEYLEFTEDYVTPGIIMAPSWPDVPINNPGFSQLFNSVAEGPFSELSPMTYSDVEKIKPDIDGQSWEDLYFPSLQSLITIGGTTSPVPQYNTWVGNQYLFNTTSEIVPIPDFKALEEKIKSTDYCPGGPFSLSFADMNIKN